MSYVEEHERRAGRRRTAGCGCLAIGLVAIIVLFVATLALTLGDCGAEVPDCHAASGRTLDHIVIGVVAICLALAGRLAWWATRSGDDG